VSPRSLLAATAGGVVVADQVAKAVAVGMLEDGRTVRVVDGVLHWTLQRNPGAAFGIFLVLFYTPLTFYTDSFFYRRRQAKLAGQRKP